jgi:nucleoside-diphosphate-sugar epimerase
MMRHCVEAASAEGVRRMVLITNVYPYGRPQTPTVSEDHPRLPGSVKGELRKQQEDIFLAANGGGLETISLRLPDFYGPKVASSMMDMVVKAAVAGKTGNLLGPADRPHEFVFTPDVGPVVRALLQHEGPISGAFNFGGCGVISMRELAVLIFRAADHDPRLRVMAPWLQAVLGLFVPILGELGEMRYLLETPVLLDDSKLRGVLPELTKTSYAEGARLVVAAEKGG